MASLAALLTQLMKRRWYPGALQWLSVLFFVPVIGYLLFGPADKDNPANLLVWLAWWPLLCILFLLAGRLWCGICPFSKVSDGIRSLVGLRWTVPDFLKEQGGWLILIASAAWLALGARPLIPLLLLSHLGHVGTEFWKDGGQLLAPLAQALQAPWLALPGLWGAEWTVFYNPLCILLGLILALALLGWTATQAQGLDRQRFVLAFGAFYLLFAGWNLYATWPLAPAATALAVPSENQSLPGPMQRVGGGAESRPATRVLGEERAVASVGEKGPLAVALGGDGWSILWLFIGINSALLALALIAGRGRPAAGDKEDFSATKTWNIRDDDRGVQGEVLSWLVEQTVQARWRVPAAVALANAAQEVITFLRGTLPPGAKVTVLAILRKNKGVMTISHTGKPLSLPDYRGEPQLDDAAGEVALAGIELRLAAAQIEHLSYHARMSDNKCSFSLRHSL